MLPNNLQCFTRKDDRDSLIMVLQRDAHCFRLTRDTLEILFARPKSARSRVLVFRGSNLFFLWNELVGNRVYRLEPGMFGISSIKEESGWTHATKAMFPDPNPVRDDCLLMETATTRDLWDRHALEYFGISASSRMLYQFYDENAYVLTPHAGEYADLRDAMLISNLELGTANAFTVHGMSAYPPGSVTPPYRLSAIKHRLQDVADEGSWQAIFDHRPEPESHGIDMSP